MAAEDNGIFVIAVFGNAFPDAAFRLPAVAVLFGLPVLQNALADCAIIASLRHACPRVGYGKATSFHLFVFHKQVSIPKSTATGHAAIYGALPPVGPFLKPAGFL